MSDIFGVFFGQSQYVRQGHPNFSPNNLEHMLSKNQTKLLDESVMKFVQKCCAAIPFPMMTWFFDNVLRREVEVSLSTFRTCV